MLWPVSAVQLYFESCSTPLSRPVFHFRNADPLTAKKFCAILLPQSGPLQYPQLSSRCSQGWPIILPCHENRPLQPSTPMYVSLLCCCSDGKVTLTEHFVFCPSFLFPSHMTKTITLKTCLINFQFKYDYRTASTPLNGTQVQDVILHQHDTLNIKSFYTVLVTCTRLT